MADPREIANGLTDTQAAALTPFVTFSNADGRVLKGLGLLAENDGVWTHTKLGMAVRTAIKDTDHG